MTDLEAIVQLKEILGPKGYFEDTGAMARYLVDWRGAYRGVGLEPTASLFDLGIGPSTEENPVSARGVATAIAIEPGMPLVIDYRVTAFPL